MGQEKYETIVLLVGGSMIVKETGINTDYLAKLHDLIQSQRQKHNRQFTLVAGGGQTARTYINGIKDLVPNVDGDTLDEAGILATRLNAFLLQKMFGSGVHNMIVTDLCAGVKALGTDQIVIASGFEPGQTTDAVGMLLALEARAKLVISLTSIEYISTDDPNKNPDAEKIEDISWADYRKLSNRAHEPGIKVPIDSTAAKIADEAGLSVASILATDFESIENCLDGQKFTGTLVHP